MKTVDDHLAPKTALPLPITLWQRFDDVSTTHKQVNFQLKLNSVLVLLLLVATLFGWLSWWVCAVMVSLSCPFYWFYKKHYQKMSLNNHSPLPVIIIDKQTINIYNNNGNLIATKNLSDYKKTNLSSEFNIRTLAFCFKDKSYNYFLFLAKECHYYLSVDDEQYAVSWEHLPFLVDSLIVETKNASDNDVIYFNKRYYINGR